MFRTKNTSFRARTAGVALVASAALGGSLLAAPAYAASVPGQAAAQAQYCYYEITETTNVYDEPYLGRVVDTALEGTHYLLTSASQHWVQIGEDRYVLGERLRLTDRECTWLPTS